MAINNYYSGSTGIVFHSTTSVLPSALLCITIVLSTMASSCVGLESLRFLVPKHPQWRQFNNAKNNAKGKTNIFSGNKNVSHQQRRCSSSTRYTYPCFVGIANNVCSVDMRKVDGKYPSLSSSLASSKFQSAMYGKHNNLSQRNMLSFNCSTMNSSQTMFKSTLLAKNAFTSSALKASDSSTDDIITNNITYEDEEDTIFALSSGGGGASIGSGATAVAVIRMSGPCAFDALRELLSPYALGQVGFETEEVTKLPKLPKARMASLRTLYDPLSTIKSSSDNDDGGDGNELQNKNRRDPLDSALVLTFAGPNSFTGEDIVELHCHGSRAVVHGVLAALSSLSSVPIPSPTSSVDASSGDQNQRRRRRMSLRPADPGEFTQRAYAHGKLGLVEVEALADLIVADTSLQRKQALQQFDGRLSRLYGGWREELIKGLAHAEAVIDFGDDEALDADDDDGDMHGDNDGGMSIWGTIRPRITSLRQAMVRHLADASRGELLRDGLRIAIVGRPNAGKSSLLNLLAGRDAAIVSSSPGTTRDVVEVMLDLGGVRCTLLDTAGVREEKEEGVNEIEVEGMKRARRAAKDAHIIVGVVDATDFDRGVEAVDELINGQEELDDGGPLGLRKESVLYVLNKLDLVEEESNESISKLSSRETFGISCTTSEGVDDFLFSLTHQALSLVSGNGNDGSTTSGLLKVEGTEGAIITRARHRRHVEAAVEALERFEQLSGQGYMALDMAAEELRLTASELGRITGAIDVEDVLDVLFADFCIGK